jgi:predicted nucleic acid-binding protein
VSVGYHRHGLPPRKTLKRLRSGAFFLVIGGNDMLIAAHALSSGAILVTNNPRDFTRIPGLICENWLAGIV